jgi:hypothetical protein
MAWKEHTVEIANLLSQSACYAQRSVKPFALYEHGSWFVKRIFIPLGIMD